MDNVKCKGTAKAEVVSEDRVGTRLGWSESGGEDCKRRVRRLQRALMAQKMNRKRKVILTKALLHLPY